MKRILSAALLAVATLTPSGVTLAQIPGQLVGAEVLPVNGRLLGVYLNVSDNVVAGLAHLRLSFYPGVDFGFQGGLTRLNYVGGSRATLRLGADVKIRAREAAAAFPFDVAFGGALGVETGDGLNNLALGPTAVMSRAFGSGAGGGVMTYGGVGVMLSRVDVGKLNETNLTLPFRFGAEFRAASNVRLLTEMQFLVGDKFNDDVSFTAGVNMPF